METKLKNRKNNKKILYVLLLFTIHYVTFTLFTAFIGCGKKPSQPQTAQKIMPKPKPNVPEYVPLPPPRKYTYNGTKYRDPLAPAGGEVSYITPGIAGTGRERMTGEKLATLQLKGIFRDKKTGSIAIIDDTSGTSYMLKNRKLYKRHKIVQGVDGVVKEKSVLLFCKDTKVELKLKKPREEKKK